MHMIQIIALVFVVGVWSSAQATTIYVEKDGGGDFSVIQDAVDAAADGDVIMIGPGRFDDYTVDPQWGNFRLWLYGDKSLTFIGSGVDGTIIGPTSYGGNVHDWGIFSYPGQSTIRLEGIRFENLNRSGITI